MENAYIYTRVSTLIQVDGFSLDAQEEEIRSFVADLRRVIDYAQTKMGIDQKPN